jgi:large subunit ribosomal protein L6
LVKTIIARELLEIPNDVEVTVNKGLVSVKGPLGKINRDFSHAQLYLRLRNRELIVETPWPDKKSTSMVGTVSSHINNMITGVLKGFTVKLKIVFAHFPISVNIKGDQVIIENFHGERRPRKARIQGDVRIRIEGDDISVQGIDVESVTQTAANIQQATKIKKKDPRVFLDGIYVFDKFEGME